MLFLIKDPLLLKENTKNINKVHSKIKGSFKNFCLLKKNVDNEIVEKLLNYNFQEKVERVVENTIIKWNARMKHKALDMETQILTAKHDS